MTLLTIFTAPKPFTNPHIAIIQRNALRSWVQLGPDVEVFLIGEEEGMAQAAAELGIRQLPDVKRNSSGTPLVSSIFDLARQHGSGELLLYINADVLLLPETLTAAKAVMRQAGKFLIVGQRWDLDVRQPLCFDETWPGEIERILAEKGRLHPRGGSDYFLFPRDCFQSVPDFAIGRAGWDNWMIYEARRQGWATIDATTDLRVIHQDHDYSHLPNGQPHYRLPETFENVRLAGGKRTIFNLVDADRRLVQGKLIAPERTWKKFWREVEIFPLVTLKSMPLGQASYAVFHPLKAYREFRAWQRSRGSKQPVSQE
jgi:hypothetical protein